MFIRTENFRTFIRMYPIVTAILTINIAIYLIYIVGFLLLHSTAISSIISLGIGSNYRVWAYHEWWRLLTPMFLHLEFKHVLFNCFSIFIFAPALEILLGKWKFSVAYFGSGIISNVLSLYFGGLNYPPFIGASAAIFGLFGVFLFIILLRRNLLDRQSSQMIAIILIANLVWTFIFPRVDVLGHLFGLLAGFVLGPLLLIRTRANWYRG
ncbi:MAG: rhomboid family intramembrane serine protease [Tuberibacillus sp.]